MSNLIFFFQEALIGIRRSALMSFISIATISLSLIVFGIFLLFTINIHNISNILQSKLEIRVYLDSAATKKEVKQVNKALETNPDIVKIAFISKKEAWQMLKTKLSHINIVKWVDKNPLPNSFNVHVGPNANVQDVAKKLELIPGVSDTFFLGDIATKINGTIRVLKIFGIVLVSLLTFATLLTIINTIHLTVIARNKEITIMQLVGATDSFIKWPFLIEGFIFGVLGSITSVLILKQVVFFLGKKLMENHPFFPFVYQGQMVSLMIWSIVALGAIMGVFGALLSVSRSIKSNL